MATSSEHLTIIRIPVLWAAHHSPSHGSSSDSHNYEFEYFTQVLCEYPTQGPDRILELVNRIREDLKYDARAQSLSDHGHVALTVYELDELESRIPIRPTNALMRKAYANITQEYLDEHAVMQSSSVELRSLDPEKLVAILTVTSSPPGMVFYNGQYAPQFQRALQRAREVYELLWGKDSHPIIKHEHGIAFLDPQLAIFNSKPEIIMIRAEYEELWEVINCARLAQHRLGASQGMVIIGHPGIGKSLSLSYFYARALQGGIPTIYCRDANCYWHTDENGCRLVDLSSVPPHPAEGTLILVDSGANLMEVPGLFVGRSCRGFLVQAASPQDDRWRRWKRQRGGLAWVMTPWQRDEIRSLQQFYELSGKAPWKQPSWYTPLEMFDLLGPSARECFQGIYHSTKTSNGPASDLAIKLSCEDLFKKPDDFPPNLRCTRQVDPSAPGSGFHRFFVSTNVARRNPTPDICMQHSVPTPFLRLVLATHFHQLDESHREALFTEWSWRTDAAWNLYEPLVFDLLLEAEEGVECKLGADSASFRLGPGLTLHPDVLDMDDPHFTPIDNRLYVLPGGYPALDALVVTEDKRRVTLLQISLSGPHELRLAAVQRAMKLFGTAAAEIQWSVLFVTPTERGRKIAASHSWEVAVAGAEPSRKEKEASAPPYTVPLGWLRIDDQVHSVLAALTEIAGREKGAVSTTIVPLPQGSEVVTGSLLARSQGSPDSGRV